MPDIVPMEMSPSYWRGRAREAQKAGRLREAVRLYRRTLKGLDDNTVRLELAQVYAEMRCISASDRLYAENLACDPADTDSLYGLARNRSLMGDERGMADLLDLYLRLSPCGDQADDARDILWRMPREKSGPGRLRRAQTLCAQAMDRGDPDEALRFARLSWKRGRTAEDAMLLSQIWLIKGNGNKAGLFASAACAMRPEDMHARLLLSSALFAQGLARASRSALELAEGLCRKAEQFHEFCGCAISLGQPDLAAGFAEKRLKEYPDSTDLMLLLAASLSEMKGQEKRAADLRASVRALDPDNPALQLMDLTGEGEDGFAAGMRGILQRIQEAYGSGKFQGPHLSGAELHRELVKLMRLPVSGTAEMAARLFMMSGDVPGLRLLLAEQPLQPQVQDMVLEALRDMGSPMPCFAFSEGRPAMLPGKPEKPYDGDLHRLVRALARDLRDTVPLDLLVREAPALWQRLPRSARDHCVLSGDDVWLSAFSAYLVRFAGDPEGAEKRLKDCMYPRRTRRAYMQLIRRSGRPYEVYRL